MPKLIDEIPGSKTQVYIQFMTPDGWKHYESAYTAARAREIVADAFAKGLTKYPAYRLLAVEENDQRHGNLSF